MRITALGTAAAYPGPGNACTGWLVQEHDTNLLLDCGTGILANLQMVIPLQQLTAVVISHMHADHFIDLIPLRYAFKYGPAAAAAAQRPRIFLPPGGLVVLEGMVAPLESDDEAGFFRSVFDLEEYDPSAATQVDELAVTFAPGAHYIPCWAISVQGSKRVVYTADTGPSDAVTQLARRADLLIAEATYMSVAEERNHNRGHLTPEEVGDLASLANPSKVLITHLWPHRDPQLMLSKAKAVFAGDVALAVQGETYEL